MRVPTPKEFQTHCAFVELVKRTIQPDWRFTHIPLGEWRDIRTAMKLLRMGAMPGWPDFVFVGPRQCLWIELKRKGKGRVLSEQADIRDHIMRCGFAYLLTDDLKDAVHTLVDLGVIRRVEVAV